MASGPLAKGKGKVLPTDPVTNNNIAITPPRTPPSRLQPQPPCSTPAHTSSARPGPSTQIPQTPSSKRKSQSKLTSFFPCKKARIETLPTPLTPAEKKAARLAEKEKEEDIKALIADIKKEEHEKKKDAAEAAKAARAADFQLKRESRAAAAQERNKIKQRRAAWNEWRVQHTRPDAKFAIPPDWKKNRDKYRNVSECWNEFELNGRELSCLEHCCVKNPVNGEHTDMRLYRLDEVEMLMGMKESMLQGVECADEEEKIEKGKTLFMERKKGGGEGKPE